MKTIINIKADKSVKDAAKKIAEELGLSLSAVVNAQLKQFVRNKSLYFSTIPRMTKELEEIVGVAMKDIKAGKNLSPAFTSVEDAIAYLDAP